MKYYRAFMRLLLLIGAMAFFKADLTWGGFLMGMGIVGGWE